MIRTTVSSTRIASVGWDNNILEIEFHDGSIYNYFDVSRDEYLSFMSAPSLGSALSKLDKVHRYTRV